MNYLLDTHVFIWALTDKGKLSKKVIDILEHTENDICISSVTFWEISLKSALGKLDIDGVLPEALPELAVLTGFKLISLNPEESATYHNLNYQWHKDPFDRMLIWQAIKNELILVTKDENIHKYQSAGLKYFW